MIYLIEQEYTEAELDAFNVEKEKWIIQRSGVKNFLADHDSGEDATGYYCGYFDLVPSNAVFENGEPVGSIKSSDTKSMGRSTASWRTIEGDRREQNVKISGTGKTSA